MSSLDTLILNPDGQGQNDPLAVMNEWTEVIVVALPENGQPPIGEALYHEWLAANPGRNALDYQRWLQMQAGASGGGTGTNVHDFVFTQASPTAEWVINHNLGFEPTNIAVRDPAGVGLALFTVIHVSSSQVRLQFNPPASGVARLS